MKFLAAAILVTALAIPATVAGQVIDLGPGVSDYTRFLVYPHLQKGGDAMQHGDRDRAYSELERARELAPNNAAVALQLAAAYRRFGENRRAETLLRDQLKQTPADEGVKTALAQIAAAFRPAPVTPPAAAAVPAAGAGERAARVATAPGRPAARESAAVVTTPRQPVVRSAAAPPAAPAIPLDARTQADTRFTAALDDKRFADAKAAGNALIALDASVAVLDDVSFKLVNAGAGDGALDVLLQAYPFANAAPAQRDLLFQRMIPLLQQHRSELAGERFQPLRLPLDTPALRSRQGVFWTSVGDCETVRDILGDRSPDYGHDDWVRLGDCAAKADPGMALSAYAAAHALQAGVGGSMAYAYAAFAAGDYRASFDAWRSIESSRLDGDALLAATTTALAANQEPQALAWLEAYRTQAGTLDDRYWSLLGRGLTRTDGPGAIAAFERAVALRPNLDDLRRLAQLETEPAKRVQWLEQGVRLDPSHAATHAELGYAYARDNRADASLQAFERSAALDPANLVVQVELGFAYWRAGRAADAARMLERAYQANPLNMMVARQLVYVEQRLANNTAARQYAERVLDTPGAFTDRASALTEVQQADLRFGFQRLHEDLGRRVTVNLDGFSGTGVGISPDAAQPGRHYQSYSQVEADVRLGKAPVRDGKVVSAYARVFTDGGESLSAMPSHNATLGAGLRWKPWRSQVIYFAAEGQQGLEDDSRQDMLLRASASFLNGGRFTDDWHPARTGWFAQNLYLDAARYLKSEFNAFTADYRGSYHKRVGSGTTVEPYAHVQFNFSGSNGLERDIRAGAGVRWNLWHGGSRYDAAPHKISLGAEFQQALDTYLAERNGFFLTLGFRW